MQLKMEKILDFQKILCYTKIKRNKEDVQMSKVSFTKLGLKRQENIKVATFGENEIEVKQYLPINEKLELVEFVLNNSADQNNFANPLKVEVFTNLAILYYYTNITFTDKQKEDAPKLFDLVEENRLIETVIAAMDETEYEIITSAISETIDAYYNYTNSVYGIMNNITNDYNTLNLEATEIENKLTNPDNLTLLKEILTKMD